VETLLSGRTLAFASPLVAVCPSNADKARGFPNLGNTCYVNAVVQCLFHCAPFRNDLELQPAGASFMGDCLQNLWTTYKLESASQLDLQPPLLAMVQQILRHTGFAGGIQQDAAECLMHLLQSVDGGRMQQRVCGAYAVASLENMILCRTTAEAHVSRNAPSVSMGQMLVAALTDDQAMQEDPAALVVRVENIYEQQEQYFAVDAAADWDVDLLEFSMLGNEESIGTYRVAGYVAHVHNGDVDALQRMRSGHYVAYLHVGGVWYEADDNNITRVRGSPSRFPYIVFLTRVQQRRRRTKQAITGDSFVSELLQARAQLTTVEETNLRKPRKQDRSGREQDRSGQVQQRSDRVRDRSGMDARAHRAWGVHSQGDNRDHSRSDAFNSLDNPFKRYKDSWGMRRCRAEETCKVWSDRAEPSLPQPCRLCPHREFIAREDWLEHVNAEHGGLQRYRNALFCLLSLSPYVVKGQEWRAILGNFSEFFARSALDWEKFTASMQKSLESGAGLPPDCRWSPRGRHACVFCARLLWQEDLEEVKLAGPDCFMASPSVVAELLDWKTYHEQWPDIPEAELKASAVNMRLGNSEEYKLVLLHKRRVSEAQATGEQEVSVCVDCHEALSNHRIIYCNIGYSYVEFGYQFLYNHP
jgi:hypothetical protein